MDLQNRFDRLSLEAFHGVPTADFEKGGREQLCYLLQAGLNPDSKLVDIGCGVLRGGYWSIHFLDPEGYHGIEPHEGRLDVGRRQILEPEVLETKRPRFDTNADFDTSVFGVAFDFFIAYSIWTHASKRQIGAMLDSFLRTAAPGARMLVTCLPANWRRPDYRGDAWFGTSHESQAAGCIHHDLGWIRRACAARGLVVSSLGRDRTIAQTWLMIRRRGDRPDLDGAWLRRLWWRATTVWIALAAVVSAILWWRGTHAGVSWRTFVAPGAWAPWLVLAAAVLAAAAAHPLARALAPALKRAAARFR